MSPAGGLNINVEHGAEVRVPTVPGSDSTRFCALPQSVVTVRVHSQSSHRAPLVLPLNVRRQGHPYLWKLFDELHLRFHNTVSASYFEWLGQ